MPRFKTKYLLYGLAGLNGFLIVALSVMVSERSEPNPWVQAIDGAKHSPPLVSEHAKEVGVTNQWMRDSAGVEVHPSGGSVPAKKNSASPVVRPSIPVEPTVDAPLTVASRPAEGRSSPSFPARQVAPVRERVSMGSSQPVTAWAGRFSNRFSRGHPVDPAQTGDAFKFQGVNVSVVKRETLRNERTVPGELVVDVVPDDAQPASADGIPSGPELKTPRDGLFTVEQQKFRAKWGWQAFQAAQAAAAAVRRP